MYPWCLPGSKNNQIFILTLFKVYQLESVLGSDFVLLLLKELKLTFHQDIIKKETDSSTMQEGCVLIATITHLYKYFNLKQVIIFALNVI